MLSRRHAFTLAATSLVAVVLGCDRGPHAPEGLIPVDGIVTLDRKPAACVVVTLYGADENAVAAGVADDAGQFRLKTFPNWDGVRPGRYRVTCAMQPVDTYGGDAAPEDNAAIAIPGHYGQLSSTPLTVTLPDQQPLRIDLQSK
jgi:hypothetical protein